MKKGGRKELEIFLRKKTGAPHSVAPARSIPINSVQLQLYKLRIFHQLNMFPVKLHQ